MRAVIFEDEPAAMLHLKKMLKSIHADIDFIGEADSVAGANDLLKTIKNPDVIFTDVQLADGTCFEIFGHAQPGCPVIFTTAYNEYAIQAFKVNAVDYLLKPIKKSELEQSIARLITNKNIRKEQIDYQKLAEAILAQEQKYDKRYVVRFGEHVRSFSSSEIAYCYAMQKSVFVATHSGKHYPLDKSLDQMESELNPRDFFRINRQFIVHINSIGNMSVVSKSRVKIELIPPFQHDEVIASTEKSPAFKEWLKR